MRCLYLAWLLCTQNEELDDDDTEPPVPPGLGELSASLESLVNFLRIDADLLHVAAQPSPPIDRDMPEQEEILAWVSELPPGEKDELLARLIAGEDAALATEILHRFMKERRNRTGQSAVESKQPTVGELRRAAAEHADERQRLAAKKAAEQKARREREAALARAKHLDDITGREAELWAEVESLIATKQPKSYDRAVELLVDLHDLAARKGVTDEFRMRIEGLRAAQARKPALIARMQKAGLCA